MGCSGDIEPHDADGGSRLKKNSPGWREEVSREIRDVYASQALEGVHEVEESGEEEDLRLGGKPSPGVVPENEAKPRSIED